MSDARRLQKLVHVACRDLGLDEDARRDLQLLACGKASMRDMGQGDLLKVVAALEARGFNPALSTPVKPGFKPAPRRDLRFVHVLWRELGRAGKLREPGRDGLNSFIRIRFGDRWGAVPRDVDDLRDAGKIDAVIQALLAWCEREGVEIDAEARGR